MCRYAFHLYKEPFACFDCRKSFKQRSRWELPEGERPAPGAPRVVLCPQCREPMADMGQDFEPPRRDDVEQWEKVRLLVENGFTFHSCGCCGPGDYPAVLRDVREYIASRRGLSEGEALLRRIAGRTARRSP